MSLDYTTNKYTNWTIQEIEDINRLRSILKTNGNKFVTVDTNDNNRCFGQLPLTKVCVDCGTGYCNTENLICPCTRKCNVCNTSVKKIEERYILICNNPSCTDYQKPQSYVII